GRAQVGRPLRRTVSARWAHVESPLRKGELAREYGCAASTTGGGETASGGTGLEDGTGTAALSGTGLAAGGGAGSDGLAATVSTCSSSATRSASTDFSSATGSADADPVVVGVVVAGGGTGAGGFSEACVTRAVGAGGTWRGAGGKGNGFDARGAVG